MIFGGSIGRRKPAGFFHMDSSVSQSVRAAAIQRSIAWLRRSIEVPFLELAMPRPLLQKQRLLALLIDAENASSPLTPAVLLRAACYGVLAVKRAYGDWTRPQLRCHEALMRRHAIEAVQRLPVAAGKNACDMALGVDAMDLLHAGVIDGLCIVS